MSARKTGLTRFAVKPRFLRPALIVLQVEEVITCHDYTDPYDGETVPGWTRLEWRDATATDLDLQNLGLPITLAKQGA